MVRRGPRKHHNKTDLDYSNGPRSGISHEKILSRQSNEIPKILEISIFMGAKYTCAGEIITPNTSLIRRPGSFRSKWRFILK